MTLPKNRVHHRDPGRAGVPPLETYVYVEAMRRLNGMSLNAFVKKFTLTFSTGHVVSDRWPSTTGEGLRHWIQEFRKKHLKNALPVEIAGVERMIDDQNNLLAREMGLFSHK